MSQSTIDNRGAGIDRRRKSMWLEATNEQVIVQHLVELGGRRYRPRLIDIEDMANVLLAESGKRAVVVN